MGSRKQKSADARKEAMKTTYLAKLSNCPTSPTKMALVAELIQGKNVYQALNILHFSPKHAAKKMEKLLTSAISNFEQKTGERAEESNLYVKTVFVDGAQTLKRFRPAPQGRAYRIRKRSNHVTLIVDKRLEEAQTAVAETAAEVTDNNSAE
ncbi:MAG TPA: 50S ribosomal protein L22 [Bacteroidia bacterium]|nr:50S ribosomal protein L22 [Bacteroidia bacterium]